MKPVAHLARWWITRPALLLFLFVFSLYSLTLGVGRNGAGYSADGTFAFEMAKSAMIDSGHAYLRDQNQNFARWGIGLPIAFAPFVAFAEPIALAALDPRIYSGSIGCSGHSKIKVDTFSKISFFDPRFLSVDRPRVLQSFSKYHKSIPR